MPLPVIPWTGDTPITSKSMNLALYTTAGALNTPQGILLMAQRPMSFEVIGEAGSVLTFDSGPDGVRTVIADAGTNQPAVTILDTAGYYGQSTDGVYWAATYTFTPAVIGTRGDGVTPGGWTIVCHFIPIANDVSTTTDGLGADLDSGGTVICSGSRQKINYANDGCPFFLDLQNTTGVTLQPSVTIVDSSSTPAIPRCNATDSSGETPRFFTIWAGISDFGISPSYGQPALPAPYPGPYTSATTIGTSGIPDVDVNSAAGITAVVNFLASPPMFRVNVLSSQSIANNSAVQVGLTGATVDVDNYSGFSASPSTYTIQRAGLYLAHCAVPFSANGTGTRRCGLKINGGTTYWGPGYAAIVAGETIATKTQIFSFDEGDTIELICEQNSGGSLDLADGDESRMFLAWLGLEGTPSTLWTPPDPSFRWAAGTPAAQLPGLFQQHLANDLGFLTSRPYLMAYQTQAQTGFSDNSWNTVVLDTVGGIIHSDEGDNYSGWGSGSSNYYEAQAAGWYLVVAEFFASYPTGSAQSLRAGIYTTTSGGRTPSATPDRYQELFPSQADWEPGATVCGLYYLDVGEFIFPQIYGENYVSSGTWGTATDTGVNSHMEIIWMGE